MSRQPIVLPRQHAYTHAEAGTVFVPQEGARFRVVYQRQYPQTVEEAVYSECFKTPEEAQKFIDTALRASASTAI